MPRWLGLGREVMSKERLHKFADPLDRAFQQRCASKSMRLMVNFHLAVSKARLAPLKQLNDPMIP